MHRTAAPATLIGCLAQTPDRIEAIRQNLPAGELQGPPVAGGWSPNEILWHIRATADVYGEHIARILCEHEPRWRHVSPRARMKKSRYDELPFAESFAAFSHQRAELVAQLEGIAPEAWERVALVKVQEREWRLTLHERVWGMANHEEVHCLQMEQLAAALAQSD